MPSLVSILLVDEEPLMRRATALMLAGRGGEVSEAATLDEAVALSRARAFDVAVVDLGSDGPCPDAVIEQLRAAGLTHARVIVCASNPADAPEAPAEDPAHGSGAAVLAKPYMFDHLLAAVFGHRAIAHHPHARAGATRRAIHASRHTGRLSPRDSADRADRHEPRRAPAGATRAPLRAARARRDRG